MYDLVRVQLDTVFIKKQWIVLFERPNDACIKIEKRALARYENLYAHTISVMRLHLSKKNDPLFIFRSLKPFPKTQFYFFFLLMPYRLIMEQICVEQPCYCDVMQGVSIEKKERTM